MICILDITIVFSGSSSLDLVKGDYDLSRRSVTYHLAGMSFREYLSFKRIVDWSAVSFDDLLKNRNDLAMQCTELPKLLGYFKQYLGNGYYPFVFEDEVSYSQKIQRTIEKTIYEDIANHYQLKTENLLFFKKYLDIWQLSLWGLNINKIAKHIGLDNKTVQHYLTILESTQMITLLAKNQAGSQLLKKTEKMYLNNADIYQLVSESVGFDFMIGTQREIYFLNMLNNAGIAVHYSAVGDFMAQSYYFETGGKSKNTKQVREKMENAYLVKDGVLYANRYEIPLYLFGLLY